MNLLDWYINWSFWPWDNLNKYRALRALSILWIVPWGFLWVIGSIIVMWISLIEIWIKWIINAEE